jgi:hypothetical protein
MKFSLPVANYMKFEKHEKIPYAICNLMTSGHIKKKCPFFNIFHIVPSMSPSKRLHGLQLNWSDIISFPLISKNGNCHKNYFKNI